jgi:hypothetical protein
MYTINCLQEQNKRMCAQYNPTEIRYFHTFKTYNDQLYALEFPDEWITSHIHGTGPECYNCQDSASWRGVIIGYCPNCAEEYDGFSRGPGFYSKAVEFPQKNCPKENSAFNTYLKGASLEDIGVIDFNLEHTIDAHTEWYNTFHNLQWYCDNCNEDDKYAKNHIVGDGYSVHDEVETNLSINVGDTIEYASSNQMGWCKYKVIYENGKKDIRLIDSYELNEF